MRSLNFWQRFDYVLLGTTVLLIIFGVLMIRSATIDAVDPDLIRRVPDQIRYAVIGVLLVFGLAAMDYRLLGSLHFWLYLLMLFLLLLVFFFGVEGDGGARSWLNLGIRIQPAEIAKVLIIVTLAWHLSNRYQEMHRLTTVIGSGIHVAIPTALIFIQPDLGTTIVFIVIWLTMIWAAGLTMRHIALFLMVGVVSAPLIWTQMEPYQRQRIFTFIARDADPDNYFNIRQARVAIGSGGWVGKGYAQGSQNQLRFLRVRHTDFIFAVIAEEFGFVGSVAVLGLIAIVILRILHGARVAADALGSMICYGVAAIIFFQTVVSIGMNLELLPVTGLTLPFVSSGGTALLSMLAGIGLAESVIIRRRRI
ncbi:MAG: FtsW/RodA/SpoVE family cell cycle protein [bacterium]|nr:FtsW/RodA/SpoVE family cell cycle protein [bacterium]